MMLLLAALYEPFSLVEYLLGRILGFADGLIRFALLPKLLVVGQSSCSLFHPSFYFVGGSTAHRASLLTKLRGAQGAVERADRLPAITPAATQSDYSNVHAVGGCKGSIEKRQERGQD
jgi:hypothetical protein